jgi:glycyl-tRNA synthetase
MSLRDHVKRRAFALFNAHDRQRILSFPVGWGELWGIADRTDFDLRQHQTLGQKPGVLRPDDGEHTAVCHRPSLGADRVALAFFCDAYDRSLSTRKERHARRAAAASGLRRQPACCPFKEAVRARSGIYEAWAAEFMTDFDDTGSIGKRVPPSDEIGTPLCITYTLIPKRPLHHRARPRPMAQVRLP